MSEIRFTCTPEEREAVDAYVKAKHRWKRTSDFARYAVFYVMAYNKSGSHTSGRGGAPAESQEDN